MDAQLDFYWRHRRQIEEWAALRTEARRALVELIREDADRLWTLAAEVDDVQVVDKPDVTLLGLTRPSWSTNGYDVTIALGWNSGSLLSGTGQGLPWAGVRVGYDGERRKVLSQRVRDAVDPHRRTLGWPEKQVPWPAWVYLEPSDAEGREDFARRCISEVLLGWETLSPVIDGLATDPLI